MKRERINTIAEMAILVGVALVLDLIAGLFSPFKYGGSISPAMLPIFIIAYRRGWKNGMLAGLVFGVLQLITLGTEVFTWIIDPTPLKIIAVIALDYIVPFALLGLAGMFKNPLSNHWSFIGGIALGSFLRYLSHGMSGVLVWYTYAEAIGVNPWLYSFVLYNLPYMAASFVFCLILGLLLYKRGIWEYNLNANITSK
ncbi:MAG: energy-coupled thiamine transporter ThiT [Bacilli bacterium]|nr:energy-coupled thiamine transporter ThiT [Bacilli bacterium]MBN2876062.1 energy-coupled thiamine transporter ThiT [Bacilli bacterium]